MATISNDERRDYGSCLLLRLTQLPAIPPALRPALASFTAAQLAFARAVDQAEEVEAAEAVADRELAQAARALDQAVLALADAVLAAGLVPSGRPFEPFSRLTPARMVKLPHRRGVHEVRALLEAMLRHELPEAVRRHMLDCEEQAERVEAVLDGMIGSSLELRRVRAVRAEAGKRWRDTFEELRLACLDAWQDEPSLLRSVFAKKGARAADRDSVPDSEPGLSAAS
jgi:hypothetical protein